MSAGSSMIPCADAVRQLWDYLDRGLTREESAQVEEHLAFCRRCCGELEFAEELRAFLRDGAAEEVPRPVRERLERFLEEL